jgi:DNA polymerase III subunit epsilon
MHLDTARFCAIDIETTGLNSKKDEIIAFASVPIVSLKILVCDTFYTLIKPKRYRIEAMKYHGISSGDLKAAPVFKDVADRILHTLDGVLVGYSVEFDYTFLKRAFKGVGINLKRDWLDIAMLEKWLGQRQGDDNLDLSFEAMMARYGLKSCYRHHASADAFFGAQIFQMQLRKVRSYGVDETEMLVKLVRECRDPDPCFVF